MNKKNLIIILVTFIVFVGLAVFIYFSSLNKANFPLPEVSPTGTQTTTQPEETEPATQEGEISTPQPTEPEKATTSNIPQGWLTYTNEDYGFAISYPLGYEALDDQENLYGWPNGVVLLYKGGQSYDLPMEVWNTVAEYEAKYPVAMMDTITAHQIGNYYITLNNQNDSPEVDQIISTFTTLD